MKNYELIEQTVNELDPITYKVEHAYGTQTIYLIKTFLGEIEPLPVALEIIENKRGWNFRTAMLNGEYQKVYLPRARFIKVFS